MIIDDCDEGRETSRAANGGKEKTHEINHHKLIGVDLRPFSIFEAWINLCHSFESHLCSTLSCYFVKLQSNQPYSKTSDF